MFELKATSEIKMIIAKRIESERIAQDKTQLQIIAKSGVKATTYRKFENTGEGTFDTFIKIVRALGKIGELEEFMNPTEEFSAKDAVLNNNKNKIKKTKKRVRHSNIVKQVDAKTFEIPSNIVTLSTGRVSILDKIKERKK